MTGTIKVCIDRTLPPALATEAAQRAIQENPENVAVAKVRPGMGVHVPTPFELALVTGKKWRNGRKLRVGFMDGDSEVQGRVEELAHTWSQFANLTFEFGNASGADIRISFEQEGSWSYLGTDALTIPKDEPTMNYGWLDPDTPQEEYDRVVVHEFGHALGAIHEHQNPDADIPWDKEAVYRYYAGPPNNWSKEDVDHNLFERYSRTVTNFSDYDPHSIMHYPIPDEHTLGDFSVGWNTEPSDIDKSFMQQMYPSSRRGPVRVEVGSGPVEEEIKSHQEQDVFTFAVSTTGEHVIETSGDTDVVMSLMGPDSETRVVGEDDDSGADSNARISARLTPGTYFVRVRHYHPTGAGKYAVTVDSAS